MSSRPAQPPRTPQTANNRRHQSLAKHAARRPAEALTVKPFSHWPYSDALNASTHGDPPARPEKPVLLVAFHHSEPSSASKKWAAPDRHSLTGANRHVEWNEGVALSTPLGSAILPHFKGLGTPLPARHDRRLLWKAAGQADEGIDHVSPVPQEEREHCHQR